MNSGQLYEFGPFRLEPDEHLLLREGKAALVTPKAFDLLVLLVRNQGRLVSKEQIMQALWPGSFVEEANITVLISSLRKVLGETEAHDSYIKTVPKKGYRFTASVKVAEEPAAGPIAASASLDELAKGDSQTIETDVSNGDYNFAAAPVSRAEASRAISRNRILIVALGFLVCLLAAAGYRAYRKSVAQRTLAVLPLRNLRQDPDSDFLGFSLADAVISKVGVLSSVTVRPSSAIEKYKGRDIDIKKVAAELNVDTLLTGNFIRDGDHLRITYQLIDVSAYKILCKDVVDLKYDELLAVHDNVAKQIIKGLQLNLSPADAQRIQPDQSVKPAAYEYYLRGVDLVASHNFPLAVKMLEKSAEIDPKYPLTWAYLGQAYTSDGTFELGGREQYRRAQAAYERALALQPKQPEAETFLANLMVDTGKVEQAVRLLRDAIASNSNDAAGHWELGYAYRFAGMLKESLAECKRAREIDPSVQSNGSVLNAYLYLGQYDNFLQSLPDANESAFFRFYRGFAEYHQGKTEQAAEDFVRAYEENHTLFTGIGKAFADSIAQKTPDGLQILGELESKMQQRGVGDPEAAYKMAEAYAVLGDKTSALRMLRSSIEGGFFSYPYFIRDPLLNNLRSLPEFGPLLHVARQRHEAFKKEFF
ncbi:MAG: winged helix-turn-helix domain-containing protein [Acidobacteriaceae bacterium]|nr:winged helix-turn-helix domain-containing protein [Acidobacteriaceae bacterium]MBV9295151.1 winged helix-turn-helix domain-containing protein [Acidobacteriaceae bacterium]MBV9766636.1 winged helix-turn-helix domain-containing protein [Acidobacteriaceae bacterium]